MQGVGASPPDAPDRPYDDDTTNVESCNTSILSTPANEKRAWIARSRETCSDDSSSEGGLDVWILQKSLTGGELGECEAQQGAGRAQGNTKASFWRRKWRVGSRRDVALLLLAVLIALGTVFAL